MYSRQRETNPTIETPMFHILVDEVDRRVYCEQVSLTKDRKYRQVKKERCSIAHACIKRGTELARTCRHVRYGRQRAVDLGGRSDGMVFAELVGGYGSVPGNRHVL